MANVYHWLTGSRDDVYSGKRLNYGSIVTNSSRYGSDSAFQIGTTTGANDTMSTNYTYGGSEPVATGLPNLGTGDATIAFWWQPNNSAYGGSGQRHLFQYSTGLEVYHNASISTDTQDDYNLVANFNYGASGGFITKTFDIDLTGNPWIKIYASRIGGAFYYTLFDATGSVITDNDGNQATWSNSSYTGDIYNASGSTPHIRVGGDFASGQTAGGIYDDIFLTLGHGIASGDLETDSDGYAKIDPVINSFSTSATSATSGSSVTLSWDADFGTTLQLLKYVSGLLTNTETVTGQVSKSVTISETVSYKLRATNVYGTVDSQSVQINLSQGGNNMAVQPVGSASGSLVIQRHHLVDTGAGSFGHVMIAQNPIDDLYDKDLNAVLAEMYDLDVSIETRVSSEESARAAADSSLESALNVAISTEASSRAAADASLEVIDGSIETRLSAEESARVNKDSSLTARLSDEEDARASGDLSLTTRVSAEESARAVADASLATINGSIETRVSAEESARAAADSSLESALNVAISTEASSRVAADDSLEVIDGSIETRLSVEESNRVAEVASLELIDASLETRLSNDEDALTAEISETKDDVDSLDVRVSTEISTRIADVNSLESRVSDDEDNLTTEGEVRASADTSLTTRLSSEESLALANNTSQDARISAEESARLAGDNSLDLRVDALETDFVWDGVSVATIGGFAKLEFVEDNGDMYMMVKKA